MTTSPALPASPVAAVRVMAADIKIAHSVFALPFAILGGCIATSPEGIEWRRFVPLLVLIVLAMVAARTWAMLANRLLDRRIDARNPRTAGRALPSGRLRTRDAVTGLLASALVFIVICAGFWWSAGNPWPLILSVPVLLWIGAYGFFKRWTWLCHLYLGSSLALSPPAAALAVDPGALGGMAPWWLAIAVLTWVAGFDVIYALQDVDVDQRDGLHSIPARFGARGARLLSALLHTATIAAFVMLGMSDDRLGTIYAIALGAVVTLLIIEHATVARWGTSRIALTFFTLNGIISCVLGAAGVLDITL